MWMRVGCPCSPIRNNIVTPRHLLVCGGRGSLLWLGRGCDANFGQFRVMQNFHNGSFFLPLDLQTHPLFYYLHKKIFLPEKHQIWMSAASKGIRLRRPDWSYFKGLFQLFQMQPIWDWQLYIFTSGTFSKLMLVYRCKDFICEDSIVAQPATKRDNK